MKHFILIILVVVAASIAPAPRAQAMFGRTQAERQRRLEVEQQLGAQLTSEKHTADQWQGVSFILGIGCVVTLVAGAAIGSNGRKHADTAH